MSYSVPVKEAGLLASVKCLIRPQKQIVNAVQGITFGVPTSEIIGFVGPNGAGKTTTLKILSGVLYPTSGQISVLGHVPWRREREYLRQIALVRGSRPMPGPPELTVIDGLEFQRKVYDIGENAFRLSLQTLQDLLDLKPILHRQIRAISLGQRMRAGLAYSLIYQPKVIFLDEPTIGLDVTAVTAVRTFLSEYQRATGAVILLTSHNVADVQALCHRVILIDKGRIRYDGQLAKLVSQFADHRLMRLVVRGASPPQWEQFGDVVESDNEHATLRVPKSLIPSVTARAIANLNVVDLSIQDPPLEQTLAEIYRAEGSSAGEGEAADEE